MPGFLRQATASQSRSIGPFVSDSDFKTLQTGLTIANTDVKIIVNGGASANKNSGGGTHRANGDYGFTFDATDTATVGQMKVTIAVSTALVVFDSFTVLEEAVYDALFASSAAGYVDGATVNVTKVAGSAQSAGNVGEAAARFASMIEAAPGSPSEFRYTADAIARLQTVIGMAAGNLDAQLAALLARLPVLVSGRMPADVIAISGDTSAADNLETAFDDTAGPVTWQGILDQGTAQAATSTTLQLRAAASFADDQIIGAVIVITGGSAGVGQVRTITDYVGSTDTATVDAWTTTPSGTITYKIFAAPPADSTAGAIKAVTDRLNTTLEPAAGSPGEYKFTNDALMNAPGGGSGGASSGAIANAVWDTSLPGSFASGKAGNMLGAIVNVVSGRLLTMLEAASGSPGEFRYTADALVNAPAGSGGGGGGPSAAAIADAVWDEALLGHLSAGSAGAALVSSGAAGDRLLTMTEAASGSPGEWKLTPDALRAIISVTPTAIENADALLNRDMAIGVDSGSSSVRTVRQALRILRNKWTISGATQSIKKEDDSTESWSQTLTTTAGADPVTGTDPAGP
jgi:hypothetical protein